MIGSAGERREVWQITFRHSLGELGRHAAEALRNDGVILGWKSGHDGKVLYPPRSKGGAGDLVPLGPGAELLSPLSPSGDGPVLARVRLDGADCGMFAKVAAKSALAKGARLTASAQASGLVFRPEGQDER